VGPAQSSVVCPTAPNSKAREKIRVLTISKTLVLSDIILKIFHVSILRSSEWALSSLPSDGTSQLANGSTKTLQKNYRPIQWAGDLKSRIFGPLSPGETGPLKGRSHHCQPLFCSPTRGSSNSIRPLWYVYMCVCVHVCIYLWICICVYISICVCG